MQTLTTTTYVLQGLLREIHEKYPTFNFVYSKALQYPYDELQERGNNNTNSTVTTSFPLMGFNRTNLRNSLLGSRGNRFSAYGAIPNTVSDVIKYRVAHCELDFNFQIVDKDVATIESFELDYLSKEGLGRITEFDVDFSPAEIGILHYYVTWNPELINFNMNSDENSYISIDGSATIRGFFVSLYGQSPLITSIKATLYEGFQELEAITIVPPTPPSP